MFFEWTGERDIRDLSLARTASLALPLGAGLLLGLVGPFAEEWDHPIGVVVGVVFSSGWSWACFAFLVGYFRESKIESTILASIGLAIGVVAYYVAKDWNSITPDAMAAGASGGGTSSKIEAWAFFAFAFGAPLGFLGNVARVPGVGGLFFRLLIPLVAYYEMSMRLSDEARGLDSIIVNLWATIRVISVVVALALVGHTIWSFWRTRRSHSSRSAERDFE
ncbi:hypothetical protein [Streptomyces yangpuensis]|uniref:hypothetical protein n=1 Tax=Streptomyces yangpuensis TaxID=1648182 RepID=UPI00382D4B2B